MMNLNLTREELEMLDLSLCGTICALEDELDEMQTRQTEFAAKYGRENSILVRRMSSRKDEIKAHEALLNKVFDLKFGRQ